uniref:Signal transducer and activator of transcription 4 n=1 Tax=Propithecus coquereli TaxID=379532 RepID=A0A2K6GQA4_PROCO
MSQWNQVQQLEIKFLEQVDQFYDDNFPMEIRHLLAQWIENQDWEAASNNETMATILLQNLLIQLDEHLGRVSKEKNLLLIHNLKRIRKVLQFPGLATVQLSLDQLGEAYIRMKARF